MVKKTIIVITVLMGVAVGALWGHSRQQTQINGDLHQTLGLIVARVTYLEKQANEGGVEDVKTVTVAAYTPRAKECDSDPHITASMKKVRAGSIAVSRDLFKLGWVFGKKVYIEGVGMFEILDLTNSRWVNRIDVLLFSEAAAKDFGIKEGRTAALLKI